MILQAGRVQCFPPRKLPIPGHRNQTSYLFKFQRDLGSAIVLDDAVLALSPMLPFLIGDKKMFSPVSLRFPRLIAAAAVVVAALVGSPAQAAPYIHLSSTIDLSGSPTTLDVTPWVPFSVYVIADGFDEADIAGIQAAEWSLDHTSLPWIFTNLTLTGPSPVNAGNTINPEVAFGGNVVGEPLLLATYQFFATGNPPTPTLLSLGGIDIAFGGLGVPAYTDDQNNKVAFSFASDLLINPTGQPAPELYPPFPEPSSLALLGLGGLMLSRRRRA